MRYLIEHETELTLDAVVREHHCELRLAPREGDHQKLLALRIEVEPDAELHSYVDCFGNRVHHFAIVPPHDFLITRVRAEVETSLGNPFDYAPVPVAADLPWIEKTLRSKPWLWMYVVHRSPATPDLSQVSTSFSFPSYDQAGGVLSSVLAARDWIGETLRYDADTTHVHSPLHEVLETRAGVCQDFAHLLVAIVRSWGIPARYVMGYQDLELRENEDTAPQSHAWAEVMVPGAGWRGFDPTSGLVVNDRYVAVAVGRDYLDAAPQRGSFKGDSDGKTPEVRLSVTRDQQ